MLSVSTKNNEIAPNLFLIKFNIKESVRHGFFLNNYKRKIVLKMIIGVTEVKMRGLDGQ